VLYFRTLTDFFRLSALLSLWSVFLLHLPCISASLLGSAFFFPSHPHTQKAPGNRSPRALASPALSRPCYASGPFAISAATAHPNTAEHASRAPHTHASGAPAEMRSITTSPAQMSPATASQTPRPTISSPLPRPFRAMRTARRAHGPHPSTRWAPQDTRSKPPPHTGLRATSQTTDMSGEEYGPTTAGGIGLVMYCSAIPLP
jgi:hypothetical protein